MSWTKNYLTSLATRLQAQGSRVHAQYLEGTFAEAALTSYAEQHADVQLIALATHGRGTDGRLLLGSVAKKVYASAPARASLLLLHPPKDAQISSGPITSASYQTIVVPLESIMGRERVLEQATTLALACQASILLVAYVACRMSRRMPTRILVWPSILKDGNGAAARALPLHCGQR